MVEIFLNTNLVIYNKLHTHINKASKLNWGFQCPVAYSKQLTEIQTGSHHSLTTELLWNQR